MTVATLVITSRGQLAQRTRVSATEVIQQWGQSVTRMGKNDAERTWIAMLDTTKTGMSVLLGHATFQKDAAFVLPKKTGTVIAIVPRADLVGGLTAQGVCGTANVIVRGQRRTIAIRSLEGITAVVCAEIGSKLAQSVRPQQRSATVTDILTLEFHQRTTIAPSSLPVAERRILSAH